MRWNRHIFQPCRPLGPDGTVVSGSKAHIALSRAAAQEGIVLLKNEGKLLPLRAGESVVLLGKASEEYIKGGGGSGDVTVAYVRTLYDALAEKQAEGKLRLYSGLHTFYAEEVRCQHQAGVEPGMTEEPALTEEQLRCAAQFSDTAILTICRFSGEGWDRHSVYEKETDDSESDQAMNAAGKRVFARGDFYLSDAEEALFRQAKRYFSSLIVVLNVGGVMDTAWFFRDDAVKAAVFAGQGGMEGAMACADVLCGDVTPSGKLVDTFADSLEAYPSTQGFHDSAEYVEYTEDIYVGYRYFETIAGKARLVNYPFGYGLSYTSFEMTVSSAKIIDDCLRCSVKVRNTGSFAGKETVQLYLHAPSGKLGKPKMQLIAFDKTPLLQPGDEYSCFLAVPLSHMASYDDCGAVRRSAWVLEKGCYRFFAGNSVRSCQELPVFHEQPEDRVVLQASERLKPHKLSKRMQQDGSFAVCACSDPPCIERPDIFRMPELLEGVAPEVRFEDRYYLWPKNPTKVLLLADVAEGTVSLTDFLDTLTLEECICLLGGQPNTGVANTFGIGNNRRRGIPNIMTADGPAGLRIKPEVGIFTTAWPCATSLACTWNRELVRQVGNAAALEVKENNIGIWLTPAMNIHRSPLCGRNFEYYSEDPLIAGEMGSAAIQGIQAQGVAATPKHFALNNKETNRKSSDSRVSERAAREIYLKGFEIAVKQAKPWIIMSSYNLVNGIHASENSELLTDILRDEWGFDGIVVTDWWTRAEHWRELKAGNDVKMGNGYPEQLREAYEAGRITEEEIRLSAERVLRLLLRIE